jgi:hypothetical protein
MDAGIWVPITFFFTLFGMITAIAWLRSRDRKSEIAATSEVQMRMLDRFASAPEFIEFARSPEGQKFLNAHAAPKREPLVAVKILQSVRWGIVMTLLGIGFFALAGWTDNEFAIPAAILISIGIGFILSAWVSSRLSRRWGLMPEGEHAQTAAGG